MTSFFPKYFCKAFTSLSHIYLGGEIKGCFSVSACSLLYPVLNLWRPVLWRFHVLRGKMTFLRLSLTEAHFWEMAGCFIANTAIIVITAVLLTNLELTEHNCTRRRRAPCKQCTPLPAFQIPCPAESQTECLHGNLAHLEFKVKSKTGIQLTRGNELEQEGISRRKNIEEKKKYVIEDQIARRLCYHYLYSKLVLRSALKQNLSPGSCWPLDGKPCFVEPSRRRWNTFR